MKIIIQTSIVVHSDEKEFVMILSKQIEKCQKEGYAVDVHYSTYVLNDTPYYTALLQLVLDVPR